MGLGKAGKRESVKDCSKSLLRRFKVSLQGLLSRNHATVSPQSRWARCPRDLIVLGIGAKSTRCSIAFKPAS